jgi:hypothetical protein
VRKRSSAALDIAAREPDWQPYLDGTIGFDEALEAVVRRSDSR